MFPNLVLRESGDGVIYDPSRLRGISALAMPSQDLNVTPYSTQCDSTRFGKMKHTGYVPSLTP